MAIEKRDKRIVIYLTESEYEAVNCAEVRAHGIAPVHRGHPAYQYMRDGDGDGVVCE